MSQEEKQENINIIPAIIYEGGKDKLKVLANIKKIYKDTASQIESGYITAETSDYTIETDEKGDLVRIDKKTGKVLCKVSNNSKETKSLLYDKSEIEK